MDPDPGVMERVDVGGPRRLRRGAVLLALAVAGGLLSRWLLFDAPRDWPRWVLMGFFPLGFLSLGVALIGLHHLTGLGSWATELGHSFEACKAWWGISFVSVGAAGAFVAWLVGDWVFLPAAGGAVMALWIGLSPPWWFWEAPVMRSWRDTFGDRVLRIGYAVLGLGLLVSVVLQ